MDTAFFLRELIDLTFVSTDVLVDEDAWSCIILSGNMQRSNINISHDDANEATMTGIIVRFSACPEIFTSLYRCSTLTMSMIPCLP